MATIVSENYFCFKLKKRKIVKNMFRVKTKKGKKNMINFLNLTILRKFWQFTFRKQSKICLETSLKSYIINFLVI